MKKPGIGMAELSVGYLQRVSQCLETIMGRRGSRVAQLPDLVSADVSAGPTADEHNALREDVAVLRAKINELLTRIQD